MNLGALMPQPVVAVRTPSALWPHPTVAFIELPRGFSLFFPPYWQNQGVFGFGIARFGSCERIRGYTCVTIGKSLPRC